MARAAKDVAQALANTSTEDKNRILNDAAAALEAGDILGECCRGRAELIGVIGTLRLTEELLGALRGSLGLHDLCLTP